jgi:hypothetical protein
MVMMIIETFLKREAILFVYKAEWGVTLIPRLYQGSSKV